ncbi:hypothetical protein EBZ80_01185 [bacterium]|nr:hypothetical protein [bacterium]
MMDIRLVDKIDVQIRLTGDSPRILILRQATEWTMDQLRELVEFAKTLKDEPLPHLVRIRDPVACTLMVCR